MTRPASRQIDQNSIEFAGKDSWAADIAMLKAAIVPGAIIQATHYNMLATMVNNMNGHYHNYTDLYWVATYGNNNDRNTYQESKNTNSIDAAIGVTGVNVGDIATATKINELSMGVAQLRVHSHGINDRTGK